MQPSPRNHRFYQDFRYIVDGIKDAFADHFGDFSSFVTSAAPKDTNVVRGSGLPEMLDFWLKPSVEPKGVRLRHSSGRVFDGLTPGEADLG